MKILLPYRIPHDRKIDDYSVPVQGGGEMFYRSIYENFDVETYQIPFDIVNFDFHEKKKFKFICNFWMYFYLSNLQYILLVD